MLVSASIVPAMIKMIINIRIFIHVRSSSNRIHPSRWNTVTNIVALQNPKISRREIAMLKQMTYMFVVLILGWSPVYITRVVSSLTFVDPLIYHLSYVVCEASTMTIVLNLFLINRKLRQYLWNKIRLCCAHR